MEEIAGVAHLGRGEGLDGRGPCAERGRRLRHGPPHRRGNR